MYAYLRRNCFTCSGVTANGWRPLYLLGIVAAGSDSLLSGGAEQPAADEVATGSTGFISHPQP